MKVLSLLGQCPNSADQGTISDLKEILDKLNDEIFVLKQQIGKYRSDTRRLSQSVVKLQQEQEISTERQFVDASRQNSNRSLEDIHRRVSLTLKSLDA